MDGQRELLLAKLRDCLRAGQRRPCYMGFLDESEAAFCRGFLRKESAGYLLWGGYEEAERVMAGFFPDYMEPSADSFPLTALTFKYRFGDKLGHRDFLGAFMQLGIERSVVGDILVGEGRTVAFIRQEMERYFLDNLRKIGRMGVKIAVGCEEPLPSIREYKDISGVVASDRLDCIAALLCRTSREKAARLITSGAVMVDHQEVLSVDRRLEEGDVISVRGHGKFVLDSFGPLTGKGRLTVKCRKYQ
ncbi:MAG: hypothetical protein HFE91_12995 [Acutalibacter sp.]|uniref:YlmH family RNA-binding protein n=1 Tax=Acutalibacter sp. TaxID=1918636 RepID=UPI00216F188E|nr:YlmH/Sll1252 family protein [Acutalibacter sp.]MCI9226353.1 hypothetical protein [Acutalibacter sp.]